MLGRLMMTAAAGIGAASCPLTATAQTSDPNIEQVKPDNGEGRPDLRVPQVGQRSADADGAQRSAPPARPVAQLSSTAQSQGNPVQLTVGPPSSEAAPQTYRGKTAQPSEALSRPSEGRTGAVTRVEGRDRCDGNAATASAICARVIETRAAEFTRPDPLRLSPEQRLLVDQRVRENAAMRLSARRSVEDERLDPNAPEGQAVAATAFARQEREDAAGSPTPTLPELPEASAAVIDALLRNVGAQPPR